MQVNKINSPEINDILINSISKLNFAQQLKLVDFINSISDKKVLSPKILIKYAGSIDKNDIILIQSSIDEGCEGIDANEW